jgi:hypothetical protein
LYSNFSKTLDFLSAKKDDLHLPNPPARDQPTAQALRHRFLDRLEIALGLPAASTMPTRFAGAQRGRFRG